MMFLRCLRMRSSRFHEGDEQTKTDEENTNRGEDGEEPQTGFGFSNDPHIGDARTKPPHIEHHREQLHGVGGETTDPHEQTVELNGVGMPLAVDRPLKLLAKHDSHLSVTATADAAVRAFSWRAKQFTCQFHIHSPLPAHHTARSC